MPKNVVRAPNQKLITVQKSVCDRENIYTRFNVKNFNVARKVLSSNAFCLWTYIAQNQDGYTFALSSEAFEKYTGLGRAAYNAAVTMLEQYGYLQLQEGTKNDYIFQEELSPINDDIKKTLPALDDLS